MQIVLILEFPVFFFVNLRETCLLIDPKKSSAAAKQYVALIVGEFDPTLTDNLLVYAKLYFIVADGIQLHAHLSRVMHVN